MCNVVNIMDVNSYAYSITGTGVVGGVVGEQLDCKIEANVCRCTWHCIDI